MKRVTIYIDHLEDDTDFSFMLEWLERWKGIVNVANYSSGGWEHVWDIEASEEAISEIPEDWHCASDWATPEIFGLKDPK